MNGAWVKQVRTGLEITRVLGDLAVHNAGVRRRNEKVSLLPFLDHLLDELLHGFGVFFKIQGLTSLLDRFLSGERLEVADEITRLGQVDFGLFVKTSVNGIVRTLKETVFAVMNELGRLLEIARSDVVQQVDWGNG